MKSKVLFLSLLLCSAFAFAQDCASVTVTGGNGQITVGGLTGAPIIGVQVFNSSWASVFNQTYTNQPGNVIVSPLAAGQYFVNVRFYNANWSNICEKASNATVTSGPPPGPADTCGATFQKTFGTVAGDDQGFYMAKSSDGGFIAVGQSAASGTTNYDGLVMKFGSTGNLLWSRTIGGAQADYFEHVVATADGGCLAAGTTNSSGVATYTGDIWFVRYDGSGNVLWQKRYAGSSAGDISGAIQTSDGGFAIAGAAPFGPGIGEAMVLKTDANGNILWQKRLGTSSSDVAGGLIEDNHGGAGLIASAVISSGTWYDAVFTKFDLATGNVMWAKAYDFDSKANWTGTPQKVADGIIWNTANAQGFGAENAKPGITKTDFNGNIMWVKDYTIPNCREGMVTVLPDGGFMFVQTELPHDAASDVHLMRIDASGSITWTKKYPRAGAQWLWGLVVEGNYMWGGGTATSGSYHDVLLAKADLSGKMGSSCPSQNVTATTRNAVVDTLNFTWPTNTTAGLTASNTTYTPASNNPVENVACADSCPTVTVSNATVSENAGNAVVQVCISSPAASTIVYNYTTTDGSATSGSDYTGGAGTVTILAGQTCGTISIPITNDTDIESAENFTVSIGAVSGTVTINDDDQAQGDCSGVTITPGSNQITVTGVTAAVATVQVFNSSWATVFNQTYTNAPGTVNVPIGPGTYLVKVTFYTSNWAYICDKSENVTVVNNCPAGTICISNICPVQTVNLNDAYNIPNLPAGTTVSWHTGTPATDANRMTDQEAQNVSVSGTYYAAINISGADCYSATIPVTVTIVACSSTTISSSTLTEKNNVVQLKSTDQPATRSIMAFPNPFTRSLRVIIDSEKSEKATITLIDLQGRQLKQMPVQLSPGSNTVLMEGLDQFPSGSYFLKVNSANGTKTLKVVRGQ